VHHSKYRQAAEHVEDGWGQRHFENKRGDVCLIGSLNLALGTSAQGWNIPSVMEAELDEELSQYRVYRFMRNRGAPVTESAAVWNDVPWRRKSTVLRVLNSLADRSEMQWLKDERLRLSNEVSSLRWEVQRLRERVEDLQRENGRLDRLLNSYTLRVDRKQLASLEDELAEKWAQLEQLPDKVAV
jgi:hypothetical protein